MNIKVADRIKNDYGSFLELTHGSLMMLFMAHIPESFLPYPKDKIKEALETVTKHFEKEGNSEAVEAIRDAASHLQIYVSDDEAIEQLTKLVKNKSGLELVVSKMGNKQKLNYDYIVKNT